LLASDGSVCSLYRLLTLHWVRVVWSGLTSAEETWRHARDAHAADEVLAVWL